MGIPSVATRCGGLPEILKDQETGFLVDVGDAQQLAGKIQLLAQSRELRERMGKAARSYALENLTSRRMAKELESILISVRAAAEID
jgi:glycosyltransferase involved in cell wall biosynthesis